VAATDAAFGAAQKIRNGTGVTRKDCTYWAKVARRYSFNRSN